MPVCRQARSLPGEAPSRAGANVGPPWTRPAAVSRRLAVAGGSFLGMATLVGAARARAWIEVDGGALRRNLERVRDAARPGAKLVPMVKSDAYGTGMPQAVEALRPAEPFGFGVATVEEGTELRRAGAREPVLLFSPAPPAALDAALGAGLVPCVSDLQGLEALVELGRRSGRPAAFQVEVDTGMGRAGFFLHERSGWWDAVSAAVRGGLRLAGVFTHLHSADAPDLASARRQAERFDEFVAWARREPGPGQAENLLVHCSNSAGALRIRSRTENAVRPGVFLYGGCAFDAAVRPEPVVALRARAVLVRDVPAGTTVGYGAAYKAPRPERWATVALGYGDGLPRGLGARGAALAAGRRSPIVGRISMNSVVVRVSGDVGPGDVVTFLGRDAGSEIGLDSASEAAGTISYELLTGLSPRLPRIWLES